MSNGGTRFGKDLTSIWTEHIYPHLFIWEDALSLAQEGRNIQDSGVGVEQSTPTKSRRLGVAFFYVFLLDIF